MTSTGVWGFFPVDLLGRLGVSRGRGLHGHLGVPGSGTRSLRGLRVVVELGNVLGS